MIIVITIISRWTTTFCLFSDLTYKCHHSHFCWIKATMFAFWTNLSSTSHTIPMENKVNKCYHRYIWMITTIFCLFLVTYLCSSRDKEHVSNWRHSSHQDDAVEMRIMIKFVKIKRWWPHICRIQRMLSFLASRRPARAFWWWCWWWWWFFL